jgi:glycosyltransferase involved in cell wall biosynthesis
MRLKAIWITWENQRRNRELSRAFGTKLYELAYIDNIANPFKKYLAGIGKTIVILLREKPELVVCQNPSLILSSFLLSIKRLLKLRIVVDAHNAGLFPKEGRSRILMALSRLVQSRADLTLVTNDPLRRHVEMNGGRGFVLQDRIPDISGRKQRKLRGRENILFICSYADDEPYEVVFEAARNLNPDICFYVTGDYRKRGIDPSRIPDNVILLGFVPEEEYVGMLCSVDATIDLTTRENCLVCGAYETVAVEKPMILSKTKALMEYFNMGAVYAEHTHEAMERAIQEAIERKKVLTAKVKRLRIIRQKEWEEKKRNLEDILLKLAQQRCAT